MIHWILAVCFWNGSCTLLPTLESQIQIIQLLEQEEMHLLLWENETDFTSYHLSYKYPQNGPAIVLPVLTSQTQTDLSPEYKTVCVLSCEKEQVNECKFLCSLKGSPTIFFNSISYI